MSTITRDEDRASGFTTGQTILMFVAVEGSLLSGVAILFLVFFKLFHAVRRRRRSRDPTQAQPKDACGSILFLSLMAGEMIRSVAAAMTLRWVLNADIVNNSFCHAQGYLKLIGTNAIDFTTLMITAQVCTVLILRWDVPLRIEGYLAAIVWVIVLLIAVITFAAHPKDVMGPTGFWCWITVKYKTSQIMAEYIWMWIIGVLTLIVYGTAALILRGNLILDGRPRWVRHRASDNVTNHFQDNTNDNEDQQEARSMANRLLWYPVVYLVCITPQSFGRWFFFSGYPVPYQFTLFARTLFSLSGLFNVLLFFNTRYGLVTGGPSTESIATPTPSTEKVLSPMSPAPMANSMGWHSPESHHELGDYRPYRARRESQPEASTSRDASTSTRRTPQRERDEEEAAAEDYGLAPL